MTKYENIIHWNQVEEVEMFPGFFRRTLGITDSMMIVEFRALAGASVPDHKHPNEQVGYVVSGQMNLTIDGQTVTVIAGDSYAIPGDVLHGADFDDECVVIDCFSPPREDYMPPEPEEEPAKGPESKYE